MAATRISAAMRTMTIHSRYSPVALVSYDKGQGTQIALKHTMRMTQLVLQHGQQVRDHTHSLLQQVDSLIHLQVAPHSLINRVELWLCPHELRCVEHGTLEMDIDAEDEELANLHVDLTSGEVDATGPRNGAWNGLSCADRCVQ